MKAILAIDTAGQTAGVAVALGGEVRAWAGEHLGDVGLVIPGHGEVLAADGLGERMRSML